MPAAASDVEANPLLPGSKASGSKSEDLHERCAKFWHSSCGMCLIGCSPCVLLLLYVLFEVLIYLFFHQAFQCWALQYPWFANVFNTPIEVVDSIYVGRSDIFLQARADFGDNFCAAGLVWLGSFKNVSEAVTHPQARTYQLGEHPLLPRNLPDAGRTRNVFLLDLSDKDAGGSGDHEAFRKCFIDYLLTNIETRRKDDKAEALLAALTEDYSEMAHGSLGDPFFSDTAKGLQPFIMKYLHYVMFGIDPSDDETVAILAKFFSGQEPIAHYFWPHGYFLGQHALIDEVSEVYMKSKAFEAFVEANPAYFNMTSRELASLSASIMRIAGVQGFFQISKVVLAAFRLPQYPGEEERFDQATVWDSLDLEDTDEIAQYIMECTRLDAPVSVTHHVALEPFSMVSSGKTYSYPSGTRIAIPLQLGNTDKPR